MNKERLLNIIARPGEMDYKNDPLLLMESIGNYPYFQPAYALLAKAYTAEKNVYAEKYTRIAAAYTGDREVLYHLIHSTVKAWEEQKISNTNQPVVQQEPLLNNIAAETVTPTVEELPAVQAINAESKPAPVSLADERVLESTIQHKDVLNEEIVVPEASAIHEPIANESLVSKENITRTVEEKEEIHNDISIVARQEAPIEVEAKEIVKKEEKTELKNFLDNLGLSTLAAYDYFAYYQKMQDLAAKKEAAPKDETGLPSLKNRQEIASEEALSIKSSLKNDETLIKNDAEAKAQKEFTFAEWIKKLGKKEEKTEPLNLAEEPNKIKKEGSGKIKKTYPIDSNSLIDNFIKSEPGIKRPPAKIFTPEDMAHRSAEEDPNMATETLADIYIKQGLFTKAIEIFQQLILRYPQKTHYFAGRIEEVKNKKN